MPVLSDPAPEADTWFLSRSGAIPLLLAFAAFVLAMYFRNLWILLAEGPRSWELPELGQSLRFTGLPYAREALLRAAWAVGATAILLAAISGVGRLVTRWLLRDNTAGVTERLVVGYGFGAGVLAYALLALGSVGLYRPRTVATLLILTAAASIAWHLTSAGPGITAPRPLFARAWTMGRRAELPWALVAVFAVLVAAFCALAPETEYDALWYHIGLPRRWLAAGHPVDDVTEFISLYPLTWELIFGGALALDGPVAARLLHWTTLPIAALIVSLITRRVAPDTSPWLAAAVFVTAPTVFWEATTTYVDLAMGVHAGVGVYALLRAAEEKGNRWLIVAGLQLGLAAATKHLGLVIVGSALTVFVVGRLRQRTFVHAFRPALLVLALALIVPSPWYVRAWRASGNPVFPEMYKVFGAQPPERWSTQAERGLDAFKDHFGRPRTARNLILLPWDMTLHTAQYGGTLGPMFLAFLPLGILASRRPAARALLAGTALYIAVWASPLSSYQMRFLVPAWVALAPVIAAGMQLPLASGVFGATGGVVLRFILAGLLLVNLPPWTPLHERDREGSSGWLTHVVREPPVMVVLGGRSEDDWLREGIRSYAAWQWIDANTPASARVLTFFGGDHLYTHRRRLWSESVIARAVTWNATNGDGASIPDAMRRLGLTYVLAPSDELQTPEYKRLDILQPAFAKRHFETVYTDRWTVVYRVREESVEAGTSDHR